MNRKLVKLNQKKRKRYATKLGGRRREGLRIKKIMLPKVQKKFYVSWLELDYNGDDSSSEEFGCGSVTEHAVNLLSIRFKFKIGNNLLRRRRRKQASWQWNAHCRCSNDYNYSIRMQMSFFFKLAFSARSLFVQCRNGFSCKHRRGCTFCHSASGPDKTNSRPSGALPPKRII